MAHPALSLFLPHPHNNHKAKIIWPQSLVILIGIFIIGRSVVDIFISLNPGVLGYASQISPTKIVEYTNNERLNAGLNTVTLNSELSQAAAAKAADMLQNNYWAHVSPTGTEPWSFIVKSGYNYQHAGENLARDFNNPQSVVAAWMASPTHRQNVLDSRYKDIGVAVVDGYINGVETTLVVQMFGVTQDSATGKIASAQTAKSVAQEVAKETVDTALASETKIYPIAPISPFDINRVWSLAFIIVILFVLAIDWLFVLRYRVVRISGKTWAHLTYFIVLALILLVIKQGFVL